MSREIKFRVWNGKEFISDKPYDLLGLYYDCGEPFYAHTDSCESPIRDIHEKCTVIQFTGLKDKNGMDIYEGDIIEFKMPDDQFWGDNMGKMKIGAIRWELDYAGFISEWDYSKNQHHVLLNCDIAFDSKIIGNIFQNKDLLL